MVLFLFKKCYNNTKGVIQIEKVFVCYFLSGLPFLLVRTSMHLYTLWCTFTMVEPWPWTPGTTPLWGELVYYFKDSYRGQYVSLGTAGKHATRLCSEIPPRLRWKVVTSKENPDYESGWWLPVKIYNSGVANRYSQIKVTWKLKIFFIHTRISYQLNWKPVRMAIRRWTKLISCHS